MSCSTSPGSQEFVGLAFHFVFWNYFGCCWTGMTTRNFLFPWQRQQFSTIKEQTTTGRLPIFLTSSESLKIKKT
jgi:hypothetical protein